MWLVREKGLRAIWSQICDLLCFFRALSGSPNLEILANGEMIYDDRQVGDTTEGSSLSFRT